jgi:hypothetical protein
MRIYATLYAPWSRGSQAHKAIRRWHNEVGDILAYVNDKLVPHGFDEIVKDDFAALRQMLQRRC